MAEQTQPPTPAAPVEPAPAAAAPEAPAAPQKRTMDERRAAAIAALGGEPQPTAEPVAEPAPAPEPPAAEPAAPVESDADKWARLADLDREVRELRQYRDQTKPLTRETLGDQLAGAGITLDDVIDLIAGGAAPEAPAGQPAAAPEPAPVHAAALEETRGAISELRRELGELRVRRVMDRDPDRWPVLRASDPAEATELILQVASQLGNIPLEQAIEHAENFIIEHLEPLLPALAKRAPPEQVRSAPTPAPAPVAQPQAAAPTVGTVGPGAAPEPRALTWKERRVRAVARLEGRDPDAT